MKKQENGGSEPVYKMKVDRDVYVKMRDGIRLAVDIYRPDTEGRFPALLGMSPYSKDVQAQNFPQGYGGFAEWAHIEAGDTLFWVSRGYSHIIADVRGTGISEGAFRNWFAIEQQEDGYDLVEWLAQQPWCDGNVGMLGVSWFAIIQYLVAAQQPPHLKAINPHDGWGDLYRDTMYHGGIFSCAWPARLWSSIYKNNPVSASKIMYSEEELKHLVEKTKNTPPINLSPYLMGSLVVPENDPTTFDFLLHPHDGPFYWERSAYTKYDKIKVPAFLGSQLHAYTIAMHLPGAFSAYAGIKAPKKLVLRPNAPDRPFYEFHDEILAWYDYWLKGIDTGIMDEPPIKIWVRGAEKWHHSNDWPLPETKWMKYYLRTNNLLKSEIAPNTDEPPDSFNYEPVMPIVFSPVPLEKDRPDYLVYETEPLDENVLVAGPVALYLHASISTDDANWIVKLKDVSPDGSEFVLTRGWLKASHRELDKDKTKSWQPYHPHTSSIPAMPGEIYEYAIEIRPIANLFKVGHKIKLEVWGCDYPLPEDGKDPSLLYPRFIHLPNPKETLHTIYHTPKYLSHLLLPIIPGYH
ncbi:CocE/NonD family hydrolase [Thermodesulfobacteriota bacterium]